MLLLRQTCAQQVQDISVPTATFQSTSILEACRQFDLTLSRHRDVEVCPPCSVHLSLLSLVTSRLWKQHTASPLPPVPVVVVQLPAAKADADAMEGVVRDVVVAKRAHTRVVVDRLRTVSSLQSTIRDFNTRVSALRSQLAAHVRELASHRRCEQAPGSSSVPLHALTPACVGTLSVAHDRLLLWRS
jgi:hypothetical protein